jgi:ferredoxin/flavodoxin
MSGPSVGVFFFSGTGNTEIVAGLLARELEQQGCRVDTFAIDHVLIQKAPREVSQYDLVGIGHPIHAFNAPRIVFDFIERLPVGQGQRTFVFRDSADPLWHGGATSMVRARLKRRGYDVFYENLFVMPANIFIKYDDRLVKQLYNKAVSKARVAAIEILAGRSRLQRNSVFLRTLGWFSVMEGVGARFFGKHLRASTACTLCNQCARDCPTGNISIVDGRVRFGWNCTLCMRCVYRCPVGAIAPRLFKFMVIKGGYDIQKIIADPSVKGDFVSPATKGYFASFREYLESQ